MLTVANAEHIQNRIETKRRKHESDEIYKIAARTNDDKFNLSARSEANKISIHKLQRIFVKVVGERVVCEEQRLLAAPTTTAVMRAREATELKTPILAMMV